MASSKRSTQALGVTLVAAGLIYQTSDDGQAGRDVSGDRPGVSSQVVVNPEAAETRAEAGEPEPSPEAQDADAPPVDPAVVPAVAGGQSEASQVAQLQKIIKANREELARLKAQRDDPDSDYLQAERAFNRPDEQLEAKQDALEEAEQAEDEERAAELRKELENLQTQGELAKNRYELEIRERKATNERINLLEQSIASDTTRLKALLGEAEPEPKAEPKSEPTETKPPAEAAPAEPEPAEPTETTPAPTLPGVPSIPGQAAKPPTVETKAAPKTKALLKAEEQLERQSAMTEQVKQESRSLQERLNQINRNITLQRELLDTAQLKADNAREARDLLTEQFRAKSIEGAPSVELRQLRDQIREAERREAEAVAEVRRRTAQLEDQHEERGVILAEREAALREAAAADLALERARAEVEQLSNPFSFRNIRYWALSRGPAVLAVLLGFSLLYGLVGLASRRLAKTIASRSTRGSQAEREDRAHTLVGVFNNAASVAIIVGGILATLDTAGVPVGPLLGGAAVVGLAVAFGAQNLVRDFFSGFMILLESQFKLNDWVTIGEHSGQVEQITLRMTALRDLEGSVHFIPNGEITSVTNMTHGWARALLDIGVAYKENVDHVISVIMEVGRELRKDPKFRTMILEDPTMLGVDAFADSAVMIKFFIKTRPMQQWAVRREMLRRLKNRFDALGIEIPFPHRTVFHRTAPGGPAAMVAEADRESGDGNGYTS